MTKSALVDNHNITITGPENGQPMLFAHGFGCDQEMWRHVAPHFEDRYRVILFDYVGSGRSKRRFRRSKYQNLSGYVDDLVEICTTLDLRDIIFVGHSVSAMIGLLAVQQIADRFTKTILISPSPCYLNVGEYLGGFERKEIDQLLDSLESNYQGWSDQMASLLMYDAAHPELTQELSQSFCRMDPTVAYTFATATFLADHRSILPGHAIPTLILQNKQDRIAAEVVGEYTSEQIPGSQLVYLDNIGHCPHLSSPQLTIDAIENFL
ncbi:alpha/beta fold hydrolase [Lewinella sp. IMCC34191]|uniref:alpha/beta fold hydrolase n=1 Tax=Lewinella sp. IMCC34191 TaxID=2259172 RepID=UPI0018E55047|nr:alpha/beta hydrolase [Lewinella sp. IMCC34191]